MTYLLMLISYIGISLLQFSTALTTVDVGEVGST